MKYLTQNWNSIIPVIMLATACMFLLGACTTDQARATGKLALAAKIADILIQSGQPQNVVISGDLAPAELDDFEDAVDAYNAFREKWQEAIDNPLGVAQNLVLLREDYGTLVAHYSVVKGIVDRHWNSYSDSQQAQLSQYHEQALSINENVQVLLRARDQSEALSKMLEIGVVIAKVAAAA